MDESLALQSLCLQPTATGTNCVAFCIFPMRDINLIQNTFLLYCSSWTLWSWRLNRWDYICCQLPWFYSASFRQNSIQECKNDAGSGSCEPNQGEESCCLPLSMFQSYRHKWCMSVVILWLGKKTSARYLFISNMLLSCFEPNYTMMGFITYGLWSVWEN